MENKSKELEVAIKAALEAGKVLEKYFETEILKEFKEDNTPVTLADREAEDVIKKIISEVFPGHSILGEETGMTENNSEYVWHVDPLNGTRNFANGIPFFGVSIALIKNNELSVGVIYNPVTRSLFYAEKNKGAFLNDKKILVSKDDENHSMVTIDPGKKEEEKQLRRELYKTLPATFRSIRDLGSTAVHLAYVARGGLEANIQLGLQTYDFAAGALLVLEAGGKITKHDGSPWFFPDNKFIASNGVFHDKLIEEIKKQKEKLGIN
ncbi:inositol monophosphatase [Candidatus Nomurabacteria bacterium]|nr:inositol monophosphatase [Candidatus Nomurabacteria bacterium]